MIPNEYPPNAYLPQYARVIITTTGTTTGYIQNDLQAVSGPLQAGLVNRQTRSSDILMPLFNRASSGEFNLPSDNWYHIAPIGEFAHPSGITQVIDNASVQAMVNGFKTECPNGAPGLLVDYEHNAHREDGSTEAAGWIEALEARESGLWANIRWSSTGLEAIKGGRYRFMSPTWMKQECQDLGKKRMRPLRLNDATLTNQPNLKGLTPLSDRGTSLDGVADNPKKTVPYMNEQLKKLLGLSADATEDQIVAGVTALKNRAETGDAKVIELTAANTDLLNAQVETDLVKYANRFKPEAKDTIKAQLLANRKATIELLEAMPEPKPEHQALHNRSDAKTPDKSGENSTKAEEAINAYKVANRCSYVDARNAVRAKSPELFGL